MRDPQQVSPKYSIKTILSCRSSLAEILRIEFSGKKLTGERFAKLVRVVREELHLGPMTEDAVSESIRNVAGVPLTPELIDELSHRVAGNVDRLRAYRPAPPWVTQQFSEWVPVQILAVRPERGPKGSEGAIITFKIMAGTPCPLIVTQWWSSRRCAFLSRVFGFSRPRRAIAGAPPRYPYSRPAQLVNLRIEAVVDPKRSIREPYLDATRIAPALAEWNHEVLKVRFRVDPGYVCPIGHPETFPCHHCPLGYLRCPAATHRLDWVQKACAECERHDAWWDPESPMGMCVQCVERAARRRRKR